MLNFILKFCFRFSNIRYSWERHTVQANVAIADPFLCFMLPLPIRSVFDRRPELCDQ